MNSSPFVSQSPRIHPSVFVAESADLIGAVDLAKEVSVWYQTVIRADEESVYVGEGSNVQDGTIIHVDRDMPTVIGSGVTIGHRAIIHGAEVSDNVLIGMGAVVLSGARIGQYSIIGAGALVGENIDVPPFSIFVGVPGQVKSSVSEDHIKRIHQTAKGYIERREVYLKLRR